MNGVLKNGGVIRLLVALALTVTVGACSSGKGSLRNERDQAIMERDAALARAAAAETAQMAAESAQAAADAARMAAESARGAAEAAQAQAEADAAAAMAGQAAAEAAREAAVADQAAAEAARDAAVADQAAAEAARDAAVADAENAAAAQMAAEDAAATAAAAQMAAETAQAEAETAQTAAETAQAEAETAQTAAETAQAEAETAQMAAETAATEAETAQTKAEEDLAAANTALVEATRPVASFVEAVTQTQTSLDTARSLLGTAQGMLAGAEVAVVQARLNVGSATTDAEETAAQMALAEARQARDIAQANVDAAEDAVDLAVAANDAARLALAAADPSREELLTALEAQRAAELELAALKEKDTANEAAQSVADSAKLYLALEDGTSLTFTAEPVASAKKLEDAQPGAADASADPDLVVSFGDPTAGLAAGSDGNWAGYVFKKTLRNVHTDEAFVYTNKGPDKATPFAQSFPGNAHYDAGTNTLMDTTLTMGGSKVKSASFTVKSGSQTFELPEAATGATMSTLSFTGTFDGAAGTYRCTGTPGNTNNCQVTVSGKGYNLGGQGTQTWTFQPNTGATTMRADTKYGAFGWWLRKPVSGAWQVGTFWNAVGATASTDVEALQGTATYTGAAAGKYSLYGSEAGHFTADSTISVKWGAADAAGDLTGTISNFVTRDTNARDWQVNLQKATLNTDGNGTTFTKDADGTEWVMGTDAEAKAGSHSGEFFDTAGADKPFGGTPLLVLGEFTAEYGATGRMVGAYGADHSGE